MNENINGIDNSERKVHRMWILSLIVSASIFFVTEHDLGASLVESFADTTDNLEVSAEGGNTFRRIAYLTLGTFGLWMLVSPVRNRWKSSSPLGLMLLACFLWCMLSLVWSADFGLSLRRLVVLACCFLGAVGISRQITARELMTLAIVVVTTFLIIGISAEIFHGTFRPWVSEYRFSGTVHPNTQGMYLSTLCLASLCSAREVNRGRFFLYALFVFAFIFLLLTKSRTSCGALLFAIALIWSLDKSFKANWYRGLVAGWVLGITLLCVMLFGIDIVDEIQDVVLLGRQEQSESLTGRIPLWTELSTYVVERPFLGFGFESFWNPAHVYAISTQMHWGIREAHSSYLETILSIGLIGLGILLMTVFVAVGCAISQFKKSSNSAYAFICGLLIYGLLNGLTESGMVMPIFVPFLVGCSLFHLAAIVSEPSKKKHCKKSVGRRLVPTIAPSDLQPVSITHSKSWKV